MEKILTGSLFFALTAVASPPLSKPLRMPLHATSITLDPTDVQDSQSLIVSRQLHCQLVRMKGREIELEAAKAITYVNARKIRVTVASGFHFHNGKPVLAADVVATLEYLFESRTVYKNLSTWVDSIKLVDHDTFDINLTQNVPQFLKFLAAPNYAIVPKDFIERARADKNLWNHPEGCGGYEIDSAESKPDLIALKSLRGERPLFFYLMGNKTLSATQAATYDLIDSPFSENFESLPEFRDEGVFDPRQIYVALNTNKSPWTSQAARCSLFSQLNSKEIMKSYGPIAQPATDYFPQGILGYAPTISDTQNGHNDANEKSTLKQQTPLALHKLNITFLGGSVPVNLRNPYINMFRQIFPDTTSDVINSAKDFAHVFLEKNSDVLVFALKSNYLDGYEFLLAVSEENVTGLKSPHLEKAISESQKIDNSVTRALAYQKISKDVQKTCSILPLLSLPRRKVFVRSNLVTPGFGAVPINEYYFGQIQ